MHEKPLLLCLSNDPLLQKTRCLVLATWYTVVSVGSPGELEALPASSAFKLLILCHTLKAAECAYALSAANNRWPGIKVLSLGKPGSTSAPCEANTSVTFKLEPRALLDSIAALLQEPADV